MRRFSAWKVLVPPASIPLALWMFVALAGPGGVAEVDHDAAAGSAAQTVEADNGGDNASVEDEASAPENEDADEAVDSGDEQEVVSGCEEALTENAQSRTQLESHLADGGNDGNQNALDKQCGGAFAEDAAGAGEAPADDVAAAPGKSEQSASGEAGGGKANGGGQANADANGNGPPDSPGQNRATRAAEAAKDKNR